MSASCSPALARKTSLDTKSGNTETLSNTNEEQGCSEAVSSMSNQARVTLIVFKKRNSLLAFPLLHKPRIQVSDDINEMVEQIQAIQHDIRWKPK